MLRRNSHQLEILLKSQEPSSSQLKPPNMGFMIMGWVVGIEAFASPICAYAITPDFTTISGFAPKIEGLPTSTDPMLHNIRILQTIFQGGNKPFLHGRSRKKILGWKYLVG